MVTESYNKREQVVPSSCITSIDVKRYEVKEFLDSDGISHSCVKESNKLDFLDVSFREFSMSTMVSTGEVTRLRFVSPVSDTSLDMYDRINGDFAEISAKIDHLEFMKASAESVVKASAESAAEGVNVESK